MHKDRDESRKQKQLGTEEILKIRKTEMYPQKQISVTYSN